jgi:hypothetical protein
MSLPSRNYDSCIYDSIWPIQSYPTLNPQIHVEQKKQIQQGATKPPRSPHIGFLGLILNLPAGPLHSHPKTPYFSLKTACRSGIRYTVIPIFKFTSLSKILVIYSNISGLKRATVCEWATDLSRRDRSRLIDCTLGTKIWLSVLCDDCISVRWTACWKRGLMCMKSYLWGNTGGSFRMREKKRTGMVC